MTHRELLTALANHPETSRALRDALDPFLHPAPVLTIVPAADQPHVYASQAGSSSCSVCDKGVDDQLHQTAAGALP